MPSDQALLEEIRERYSDDVLQWQEIRDAGDADMLMIADGPWPKDERIARGDKENPRPCESFDELGQYLNQTIGDMRQNKRAVKVSPTGNGANDQTALKRSGMIRQIEYDSNAQTAYATACENMLKRGYGFAKLGSRFSNPAGGFEQELYIGAVPNPNTILVDPYAKEPDWKDGTHAFELDSYSTKEFVAKWPQADTQSFEAGEMKVAPEWVKGDRIQVASYWRLSKTKRTQVQIDLGGGPVDVYVDDLPGAKIKGNDLVVRGVATKLLNRRECEEPMVCQYITNGIEILEEKPQKWIEIPIIPCFGPEEFVDDGGGSKKRLLSMVRKARGAYMGYCFARSSEIEVIGQTPHVWLLGYEGQFATKTPWKRLNKSPVAYAEVKAITAGTGGQVLPLPIRVSTEPQIQALEIAASSFKLSIQSAMSIGGLLNGNRGQNADAKSGKALEELDKQENQGTFVFISNYERFLARCGRMLEQGLTWCYDSPRDAGMRSADDKYSSEPINQCDASGNKIGFHTSIGDHQTTISVGPSDDSTRDAADDFAETLINVPGCPPNVIGMAVRLKNLGPIGDKIADVFDPPQGPGAIPPALQQQMGALNQTVQELQFQLKAKIPEIRSKERMFALELDFKREQLAVEASVGAAKIGSAAAIDRLTIETDLIAQERGTAAGNQADLQSQHLAQAHEAGMTAMDQAHERNVQGAAQAHERATASSAQTHEAAGKQTDHAHDDATRQSDQAHEASMQGSQQVHQAGLQTSAQDAAAEAAEAEPGE